MRAARGGPPIREPSGGSIFAMGNYHSKTESGPNSICSPSFFGAWLAGKGAPVSPASPAVEEAAADELSRCAGLAELAEEYPIDPSERFSTGAPSLKLPKLPGITPLER